MTTAIAVQCGLARRGSRRRKRPAEAVLRCADVPLVTRRAEPYISSAVAATHGAPAFAAALPTLTLNAPPESLTPIMADPCTVPFTVPVSDDNRGINGKDASYLGDKFNALEFVASQRDRADDSRWSSLKFESLSKDVERNGRSAELATEKTAAATILAVEKAAAAAALCCCETAARVAASTASILAAMQASESAGLRQQLTVYQIRSGALAGPG